VKKGGLSAFLFWGRGKGHVNWVLRHGMQGNYACIFVQSYRICMASLFDLAVLRSRAKGRT
jgi:hypothetical protein